MIICFIFCIVNICLSKISKNFVFGVVIDNIFTYNVIIGGVKMNIELMKQRRKELGLTQQQLADLCGLSKNTIYNYESGKVEPTDENLNILSKILNISVLDLSLEDEYEITLEENEIKEVITILENNFIKKIEDTLVKKYKYVTKINIDTEKTSIYLTNILKNITNKKILYSPVIEKTILIDTNKNVTLCDFIIFEQCMLNIISTIENTSKNTETEIKNDIFIKILNSEKEVTTIKKSIQNLNNELNKTLSLLKKANTKEKLTKENIDKIDNSYNEVMKIIEHKYTFDLNPVSSDLVQKIKNEYINLKEKYLNQFKQNKEGGSDD